MTRTLQLVRERGPPRSSHWPPARDEPDERARSGATARLGGRRGGTRPDRDVVGPPAPTAPASRPRSARGEEPAYRPAGARTRAPVSAIACPRPAQDLTARSKRCAGSLRLQRGRSLAGSDPTARARRPQSRSAERLPQATDGGEVEVLGTTPRAPAANAREQIALRAPVLAMYETLTDREELRLFAGHYREPRARGRGDRAVGRRRRRRTGVLRNGCRAAAPPARPRDRDLSATRS